MVSVDGPVDWVVVNAGGHGYYRVAYSETLAKAIRAAIEDLDDLERYILVDDAWAFVESGQTTAAAFLELASAYRHETEFAVWQALVAGLVSLEHHAVVDDDLPAFRTAVSDLVAPSLERLGWEPTEGESDLTRRMRGLILGAAGRLADDEDVIARSRALTDAWLDDRHSVDPDVAQASLFTTCAPTATCRPTSGCSRRTAPSGTPRPSSSCCRR